MKISFHGASKTVTGSCYLIETFCCKFLIDCGLFQGRKTERELNEADFKFLIDDIDFMILSHAHIDHCGRIPLLYKRGYRNPIYATKATVELCGLLLPDSGHIHESEVEWKNRKRKRAGKTLLEPIYTSQDAVRSLRLFQKRIYDEIIQVNENIKIRFNDGGHILGSSIIEIWINENDKETKIVFSGDLGNMNTAIIRDPSTIDSADYLIMETTYGDRIHLPEKDKIRQLCDVILHTIDKGGNIIIPSFAVGRTQEMIYFLNKHIDEFKGVYDKLMNLPVYIDSPLATSATEVFRNNLNVFDEEAREYIRNGDNPLDFRGLRFTKTVAESKALNQIDEPKIIISASGMCDAGRIKHHLKHNLWRADSTIIFVGYQAFGTLGRYILDGAKTVKIFGEEINVKADIVGIQGFSGHADKNMLLQWVSNFKTKPKQIFLVHGEDEVIKSFSQEIQERFKIKTIIPNMFQSYSVEAFEVTKDRENEFIEEMNIVSDKIKNALDQVEHEYKLMLSSLSKKLENDLSNDEKVKIYKQIVELENKVVTLMN